LLQTSKMLALGLPGNCWQSTCRRPGSTWGGG
jgi:hypothetical protein